MSNAMYRIAPAAMVVAGGLATLLMGAAVPAAQGAITIPVGGTYLEDFDDGVADDLVIAGGNDFGLGAFSADVVFDGSNGLFEMHSNSRSGGFGNSNVRASIPDVNLSGAPGFVLSVDAEPTVITPENASFRSRIRLDALMEDASNLFYVEFTLAAGEADGGPGNTAGDMFIISRSGGTNTTLQSGSFSGAAPAVGTNYALTLQGDFAGDGSLVLSFTVDDGTDSTTLTTNSIASGDVFAGDDFRIFQTSNNGSTTARYDNLTISAIPEPASLGLLALAGLMALRRRR